MYSTTEGDTAQGNRSWEMGHYSGTLLTLAGPYHGFGCMQAWNPISGSCHLKMIKPVFCNCAEELIT